VSKEVTMRKQHSSKATVQLIPSPGAIPVTAGAAQGARRATEAPPAVTVPNGSTEVVPRPKRRFKSNAEKRRIVAQADACTLPGEVGLLMRREGIYSSNLCNWRQQIRAADALALDAKKRGPKPNLELVEARRVEQHKRELAVLQNQLDKALLIIDIQKKVSILIGLTLATPTQGSI
jgi:transposase